MAYDINYDDKGVQQAESNKTGASTEKLYGDMINETEKYYQAQIDASKQWAEEQSRIQQQKTDFAIQQIEQQKEQTTKDYKREQSGAYVDWQKESNRYGANAEQMAAQGLANTGYSESSQVSMYNTYQNRVATAREGYNLAIQNYNNSITNARIQNNAILAEIAHNALQMQLELSLEGFQHKNQLLLDKANQKVQTQKSNSYQEVLGQIKNENTVQEEVEQYISEQTPTFSTYESAAAYLREIGVTSDDGGLMTKSEWRRRKGSGSTSAEADYSTYQDYLNHFVAWKTEEPQNSKGGSSRKR